jgi:CheY-like chemotaxis protein
MVVVDATAGAGRILIVEDDRHQLRALSEFLERKGYSIIQAQNGREALHDLRNDAGVSLVLLDLSMPVMDGWEFLKRQNNESAIADIPVVALTAHHAFPMVRRLPCGSRSEPDALMAVVNRYCRVVSARR